MNPILYFLRSSEQKIVTDMLYYAYSLDETRFSLDDFPNLSCFDNYYGYTRKDMGLYALVGHELAGAAWIRLLDKDKSPNGFVDDATPVLHIAVKPEFRHHGIGLAMMDQLFLEAGTLYDSLSVSVAVNTPGEKFMRKCGFEPLGGTQIKSSIDGTEHITMIKKLVKSEIVRPSDGYDPRRWMD
ncbi:MAG: GNAT family N-acetyltransferase [Sulfuricurvum sp.]|nr:GNAT family N-acetyltransferase [Sulfuricurvum sp.]